MEATLQNIDHHIHSAYSAHQVFIESAKSSSQKIQNLQTQIQTIEHRAKGRTDILVVCTGLKAVLTELQQQLENQCDQYSTKENPIQTMHLLRQRFQELLKQVQLSPQSRWYYIDMAIEHVALSKVDEFARVAGIIFSNILELEKRLDAALKMIQNIEKNNDEQINQIKEILQNTLTRTSTDTLFTAQ